MERRLFIIRKVNELILIISPLFINFQKLNENRYQATLQIAKTTQDDIETKFKLHVTNEIGETYYRVMLSGKTFVM